MVEECYGLTGGEDFPARFNLAPTQRIPVFRPSSEGMIFAPTPWGVRLPGVDSLVINARGETARERPAFADSWRQGRCLVAADGYYEWPSSKGRSSGQAPYWIHRERCLPFLMAGLLLDQGCVILTRAAGAETTWLHPRMPWILDSKGAEGWMRGHDPVPAPFPLQLRPVSSYVNSVRNEGPECIRESPQLF